MTNSIEVQEAAKTLKYNPERSLATLKESVLHRMKHSTQWCPLKEKVAMKTILNAEK